MWSFDLVLSCLLLFAAPEVSLSVVEESGRVTVAIEVGESPRIGALDAILTYDPEVIRYVGLLSEPETNGPIRSAASAGPDRLRFAFAAAEGQPPGGTLARFEFEVRDPTGIPTELSLTEVTAHDLETMASTRLAPGRVTLAANAAGPLVGWEKLPAPARIWVLVLAAGAVLALLLGGIRRVTRQPAAR